MASVDEIKEKEGYLEWDKQYGDVLIVKVVKRNWKRANYQMDLRYIESVVANSGYNQFSVVVDLARFRVWHLDFALFRTLADGLQKRIRNKINTFTIVNATVPAHFAGWMISGRISDKIKAKVSYGTSGR